MSLDWRRFWSFLKPGEEDRDETFREEIRRLSRQGLGMIALVEIVTPVFMDLLHRLVTPAYAQMPGKHFLQPAGIIVIGILTALAGRTEWGGRRARLIGAISGWLAAAALITGSIWTATVVLWVVDYVPAQVTTVMLVGIAALPLKPLQTLALGLSIHAFYLIALAVAPGVKADPGANVFLLMITLLSTGLSALIYEQRLSTHQAHQESLRVRRDLRDAEVRASMANNAATLGRLAAVMCHELNSPIGALVSSVDTLLLVAAKQNKLPASEQGRLARLQEELRLSVSASTQRLQEIAGRIQRLTDLDRAEVQSANLNELLSDVVGLFDNDLPENVTLETRFEPLPRLVCRPQHLGAVFSALISNAIKTVKNGGEVRVSTRAMDSTLEVRVTDNGPGMSPEEIETIFEAGFQVAGGRISTGDWSLFGARQVIQDHRGEIRFESNPGGGTTAIVTLPC